MVGGKWKPVILFLLANGINRFGRMRRAIAGISKQMLTKQLRELEADGVVHREVFAEVPPRVEYSLTDKGESLLPVVEAMRAWGAQHV
ncbi:MAG: helix-turn-helix domain-containing protein [Bacteroidota bacterium]